MSLLLEATNETYIVGISEETNTGDNTGTNVIPSERSLVDLGESKSPSLIGVLNVCEVIVEVVESGVSTSGLVGGGHGPYDKRLTEIE